MGTVGSRGGRRGLTLLPGGRDEAADGPAGVSSSEELLAHIIHQVSDLVFLLEHAGGEEFRVAAVNAALEAQTGFSQETVLGRVVGGLLDPEDARTLVAACSEVVATRRPVTIRGTGRMPTGPITADMTISPVLADDGRCTHVLVVARVLAGGDRRGAQIEEAALGASLLAAMPCPAAVIDASGTIVDANRAWARMIARTAEPRRWEPGASFLRGVAEAEGEPKGEILRGVEEILAGRSRSLVVDGWIDRPGGPAPFSMQVVGVAGPRYGAVVSVRPPGERARR